MEQAKYKHLANFLRQRGQKIPGVPFLSLWQFGGAIGFGFVGYVLQLPMMAALLLGLVSIIVFYVYHGEFVGRRLMAISVVFGLALFGQRRQVNFVPAWDQLAEGKGTTPIFATITLEGESGATVLS
jgi:hypothetical protein